MTVMVLSIRSMDTSEIICAQKTLKFPFSNRVLAKGALIPSPIP